MTDEQAIATRDIKALRRNSYIALALAVCCFAVPGISERIDAATRVVSVLKALGWVCLIVFLILENRIQREKIKQSELSPSPESLKYWPLKQVLPPVFLLPLFAASFDVSWMFLWFVGGVSAIGSIMSLVSKSWRPLYLGLTHKGGRERLFRWETMTRPVLTMFIVVSAFGHAIHSKNENIEYSNRLVSDLQRSCNEKGRCPVAPDGWSHEMGKTPRLTRAGWVFTYGTDSEKKEFGLVVHKCWECEQCVYGGVGINPRSVESTFCNSEPKMPERFHQLISPPH